MLRLSVGFLDIVRHIFSALIVIRNHVLIAEKGI